MKQPWLNAFKIAIIEENFPKIGKLVGQMPKFSNLGEMEEAAALLKEAKERAIKARQETLREMELLKKQQSFVEISNEKNRFTHYI